MGAIGLQNTLVITGYTLGIIQSTLVITGYTLGIIGVTAPEAANILYGEYTLRNDSPLHCISSSQ